MFMYEYACMYVTQMQSRSLPREDLPEKRDRRGSLQPQGKGEIVKPRFTPHTAI